MLSVISNRFFFKYSFSSLLLYLHSLIKGRVLYIDCDFHLFYFNLQLNCLGYKENRLIFDKIGNVPYNYLLVNKKYKKDRTKQIYNRT